MLATSQVWWQVRNFIHHPKPLQWSSFHSSSSESYHQNRVFPREARVSLTPTDSPQQPLVLQNSSTAANTIEQQDSSLATSAPGAAPEGIQSDDSLVKQRVTLARLVKGVYELEYRRLVGIPFEKSPPARSWWESVNFDLIDEFPPAGDSSIDLAVYRWNNPTSPTAAAPASSPVASSAPPCRPVVVAIRGTLPSMEDGWHNFHGSLQRLHLTPRFKQILNVVKDAVAEHGSEDVCITGHSLGGSLGLLVARTLATEEGIQIESHLFNPVYAYTWIPTSDELLENEELWRTVRAVRCAAVAGLANVLIDDAARVEISRQYKQLQDWTPHIYINKGDPICRGYWEYFSSHERLARNGAIGAYFAHLAAPFSGRGLLTSAFGSKPLHLIPSAVLHVCEGEPPKWPGVGTDALNDRSRYFSHNLGSWMAEDLPLHTREIRLSGW